MRNTRGKNVFATEIKRMGTTLRKVWKYQRDNQKRKSKKNRQYNGKKIPKGSSEAVNQRRTDNTMAKRKKEEREKQWSIKKKLLRKLKVEQYKRH